MSTINLYEEWRKGFEVGYYYGRMDASDGREYDARTPKDRGSSQEETYEELSETGNRSTPEGSAAA